MAVEREARAVTRLLLKPILHLVAIVASPFFMLAFLFLLLEKPPLWSLIPLAIGVLLVLVGLLVWVVVRARLLDAARQVDATVAFVDHDILQRLR